MITSQQLSTAAANAHADAWNEQVEAPARLESAINQRIDNMTASDCRDFVEWLDVKGPGPCSGEIMPRIVEGLLGEAFQLYAITDDIIRPLLREWAKREIER